MNKVQIRVSFPKNCLVRRSKEQMAQNKRPYYRGIVMTNTEVFKEHYVNKDGEAIRQPETGETVFYTVEPPRAKRDSGGNILFGQYEDMVLEPWSSADGRKGLSIVEGRSDNAVYVDELNSAESQFGPEMAAMIREKIAADIAANLMQSVRNRQSAQSNRNVVSSTPVLTENGAVNGDDVNETSHVSAGADPFREDFDENAK